jgi:hypothetical protein
MSKSKLNEMVSTVRAVMLVAVAGGISAGCQSTEDEQDPRKNQEIYEEIDEVGSGWLNIADR